MFVNLPDKRYYSIGEVAKAFDVNTSLIRFWDQEFEVIQPKKNKKGNRLFTQEDIKNLQLIYRLVKEKGFTLDGARKALKEKPKKLNSANDIIVKLEAIKQELINIEKYL
ncbi:MAG: transcriptional regulator [Flavobacteriaceae bacterium CG1_02_35_72]|jgi:DNA-binding transcriptional MerR regulator|nr:MAG: transcriptional regulator [Flavobacteriaceae bacterium CG1_02_35_72]PJA04773.1 MAG: transcriptional regulator [Flavobacteriales bacterium CG_4_10_14_0_2_um_filter_35_18]